MTTITHSNVAPAGQSIWHRYRIGSRIQSAGAHLILLTYLLIAVFPVILVIMNSFKGRQAIFRNPYALPTPETFSLIGYETVFSRGNFPLYFVNSLIVTLGSMFLIILCGAMVAFALSEYRFPGNTLLGLYFALGIMIPIRLGTVSLLRIIVSLSLINTHIGLILVYTASGLPLAVFVLSNFMRQVPRDLKDAARVDGASEYRIFWMVLPLVRPALGTVLVFNMIPIWNDLWFPLILAPAETVKTVTLGAQTFLGQFVNDWNAVLASLTLAMAPIITLYILLSRQLIRGLTAGAIK
ncbi:MAG: binding-protein-dependent transport system inner membrane protein [Chloroflexi bacterium OLB15]|nr:MAG: binding-protein-dependent transport system inner membrane protein [Chloroflexi bacterium OLB15]